MDNKTPYDFVLMDARGEEAFAAEHIPGALCATVNERERLAPSPPRNKDIVTWDPRMTLKD